MANTNEDEIRDYLYDGIAFIGSAMDAKDAEIAALKDRIIDLELKLNESKEVHI